MANHPIDQKASGERPMGRVAIWPELRKHLKKWVSVSEIAEASKQNKRTVSSYFQTLVAAGSMERRDDEQSRTAYYRLIKDHGFHAPRFNLKGEAVTQGVKTDNLWQSMRIKKTFTPREIAELSSNDTITVTRETARTYCHHLLQAGYLKCTKKSPNGVIDAHYRLIRDTGPQAPMVQRVKRVFDPNLGEVMPLVGAQS